MTCFDSNKLHYVDICYILIAYVYRFLRWRVSTLIYLKYVILTLCTSLLAIFREWCYIKCAFHRWISHRINNGRSMAFSAKDIRHVKCVLSDGQYFEKYDHRSLNVPQHVCIGRLATKIYAIARREIDLYAVEGFSPACEWANKRPDEMSAKTKITHPRLTT